MFSSESWALKNQSTTFAFHDCKRHMLFAIPRIGNEGLVRIKICRIMVQQFRFFFTTEIAVIYSNLQRRLIQIGRAHNLLTSRIKPTRRKIVHHCICCVQCGYFAIRKLRERPQFRQGIPDHSTRRSRALYPLLHKV